MAGTLTWRTHTRMSPLVRTALSLVLIAASLAWGAADATSAHATPTLTVTPSSTVRVPPTGSTLLNGLAISGDAIDNLTVTVATDFGTLGVATRTNLALGYNNSWTGTQAVTFSGLQSDINNGLASVSLTTTGTTGTAHVSLTAFISQAGLYYLAANQHFYQYVSQPSVTWTTSDVAAKASSFRGQSGYLATIPNATVNSFISTKIAGANNIWFGARAYEAAATDGSQSYAVVGGTTYARVWRWAAGPNESPIQGTVISECTNAAGACTFQNAASFYSSWAGGEPNNYAVSGLVAYAGEYVAVTNWGGTLGKWNDLPPGNTGTSGYVIEYGGRPNSDPTLGTGFAGVVTATAATAVENAPVVADAPVISGTAGNTTVALTWTPPFNGGASISGYEVSLNGGAWTAQPTSSSSAVVNGNVVITVSATVSGLTNGTSYGVRMRALNSAGNGAASNTVTLTPATIPGAPVIGAATRGNAAATVTFTAPASNGGATITSYTVTSTPGGVTASCPSSPCAIGGLSNGASYTFTVHATNVVGSGAESAASNAVVPATIPGSPTAATAVRGNAWASITFTPPAGNGGTPITGYTVTAAPGGATQGCSSSPCVVNGLTNGTSYSFTVHATNAVGDSPESAPSNTVTPATTPGAPTGIAATRGNGMATVTWTVPAVDGGAAIDGYVVSVHPGSATQACVASPCVVGGLTNGSVYTFSVHATNSVGGGTESATSNAVTPADAPGIPTNLVVTSGDSSAGIAFDAPAANGDAITGYDVSTDGGVTWQPLITSGSSAITGTVTGLTNGTTYSVEVRAVNTVGAGLAAGPKSVTPATVPGAPTGVSGLRGNGQVSVSWTAPADNGGAAITGYTVTSAPGAHTCAVAGATSCTVMGLTNGTSYTFTVHATNSVGDGVESAPSAVVTPATTPGAPTGIVATPSDTSASVAFTVPASDGGTAIIGYTVTATPGGATATCAASPCVVPGLTNGTSYTFTVHSTNGVGDSGESAASSAVTPATVAGPPTAVSATGGNGSAVVTFVAPLSNGGAAVTGYRVTTQPGGAVLLCAAGPCTVTGLTNGTSYTFAVAAINAVGAGPDSAPSAPVTPATQAGAPTAVTAVRGDHSLTVSFTAPASNGGAAIASYTLTVSPGGTTVTCVASPCSVTGLTNGTAYTVTVHATNSVGDSPESTPSAAVTPATVPGAPTAVSAISGDASASVSFTAPVGNGGDPISGFRVTAQPGGATTACSASPCAVTGLSNATSYTFTVAATNSVGFGAESVASGPVSPAGAPDAPTAISATRGNISASVAFTVPAFDGGSPITGYTVTAQPGGATATCAASPCVVFGLTNGTSYTFTVHATNANGNSPESAPSNAVTPADVPGPPTAVSGTRGNGSAVVSWLDPASTGGSPITSYSVTTVPGGVVTICATSPCTITGLANGTAYTFTVSATNAVGVGPASAPSSPVTPATAPDAPTAVTAARGDRSASITFTAPAFDGGSPVISYTVTATPGGATATCAAAPCVVTGLTNGTSYTFTVHATNTVWDSAESAPSNAVIPAAVPGVPTITSVTGGNGMAVVSFTGPASDGGTAITGYRVTTVPGGTVTLCAASPCVIQGLTNGSSYTFTVAAINSIGAGPDSAPSSVVTPAGPPSAPIGLTVVRGNASATLSWQAPAANGSPITGYEVSTDGGLTWRPIAVTGTDPLHAVVTGLTNGRSYPVALRASNGVGTGPVAGPVGVTPATVPAAPRTVRAVPGNGVVTVSWTAPLTDGGAGISSSLVTAQPGGLSCTTTTGSCVVSGLTNGTTYTFTVSARNDVGQGAAASRVAAIPFGPPSAPLAPAATVAGGVVTVSWLPPANLFGSTLTGYTVRATAGGGTCQPVPATATTCAIVGLAAGRSYTFRVIAHSTAGDSAASVMSQSLAIEGAAPSLARTGAPLGTLGETGLALIVVGSAITAVARRRREGDAP